MSNWTIITKDDLKATGYGLVIDKAQTVSTGSVDPAAEEIANAVYEVRQSVAVGNAVDASPDKVPNSLKGLTSRMAVYGLMRRIRYSLSEDDRIQKAADGKRLIRIADKPERVEPPDDAIADGTAIQAQPSPKIAPRTRNFTERSMDGI